MSPVINIIIKFIIQLSLKLVACFSLTLDDIFYGETTLKVCHGLREK